MYDINDKRAAIFQIQEFLVTIARSKGEIPCVVPDGIYGQETRECIRAFQNQNMLSPTGTVDWETFQILLEEYRKALEELAEQRCIKILPDNLSAGVIQRGEESVAVSIIQALLKTLEVIYEDIEEIDELEINGRFDEATERAVKAVQRIDGIYPTGIIDRKTWDAIGSAYEKFVNTDT